jgi:putative transposase
VKELYFDVKDYASRMSEFRKISVLLIEEEGVRFQKWLAEHILERKFTEWIGAERYERCEEERAWRGGHYSRSIQLKTCRLKDVRIPRAEGIRWENPIIGRFQRKSEEFEEMVYEGFVLGLSDRKMREYLQGIFGEDVISAQGVSDIYRKFTRKVGQWHKRPITKKYKYIIWDGKWVKIRGACKRKKVVLKVLGITEDGYCNIIDFRVASSESYLHWSALAQSLYDRGLRCEGTELFIHDGAGGLIETLILLWPDIERQQCKVHHMRNLAKRVKKSVRKPMMREASRIYKAASLEQAEARARRFGERWGKCEPNAVRIFISGIEPTLTYYKFGWDKDISKEQRAALWQSISSTNILERNIQEDVRRIISMRCFTNDDCCDRTFYAIADRFNKNPWRLPGFVPNRKSAEILT